MGLGEFIPSNWFMDIVASLFCSDGSWLEGVCENVVFLLCGYDSKQEKNMLNILGTLQ